MLIAGKRQGIVCEALLFLGPASLPVSEEAAWLIGCAEDPSLGCQVSLCENTFTSPSILALLTVSFARSVKTGSASESGGAMGMP